MRSILVAVIMIIVILVIYNGTIGGPEGMEERVKESGWQVNLTIESINP